MAITSVAPTIEFVYQINYTCITINGERMSNERQCTLRVSTYIFKIRSFAYPVGHDAHLLLTQIYCHKTNRIADIIIRNGFVFGYIYIISHLFIFK
jgi:hypothetical protein